MLWLPADQCLAHRHIELCKESNLKRNETWSCTRILLEVTTVSTWQDSHALHTLSTFRDTDSPSPSDPQFVDDMLYSFQNALVKILSLSRTWRVIALCSLTMLLRNALATDVVEKGRLSGMK